MGYFNYLIYMLPAYLFVLIAQIYVKSTFSKYSGIMNSSRMTGADAARLVSSRGGANGVTVTEISGSLTDNFNPSTDVISLSATVYGHATVAAVGVAAHEAGHAVQHSDGYAPANLRSVIVPVCNIGSRLALPLIFVGYLLSSEIFAFLGIACFALVVLFQLVTLPVEFNASRRAVTILTESGMMQEDELKGVKKVLTAAAMTYVGALAVSVFQMMFYLSRTRRR